MNKWFLFILSASISLFSTHAARVKLGHYYDSIYYKFEHWDHVAAIGIAEVMFMLFVFVVHFIVHVIICLFLIYKMPNRLPVHILIRFTDSWGMNVLRVILILMIIAVLIILIPFSFPVWTVFVTISMLIVYVTWVLQIVNFVIISQ